MPESPKPRILAVDDSRVMRRAMSKVLGKDCDVTEAEHGEVINPMKNVEELIEYFRFIGVFRQSGRRSPGGDNRVVIGDLQVVYIALRQRLAPGAGGSDLAIRLDNRLDDLAQPGGDVPAQAAAVRPRSRRRTPWRRPPRARRRTPPGAAARRAAPGRQRFPADYRRAARRRSPPAETSS